MLPRERFPYSAIVDRPKLTLPGGARLVVTVVVNLEHWRFEDAMPRQAMTTPAGLRAVPDVPNWAWHEYGMRIGFWRLKAAIEEAGIPVTASINASVCLEYPRVAEAVRAAGWEFMGHGFAQKAMPAVEDEREVIRRSVEVIRDFTGKRPRGWLGPGLAETMRTADFLAEEGLEYICDWVMDDQPTEIRTTAGTLVSIPYSVELNDIAIMVLQNHPASMLYERSIDHFERLHEEGAQSARCMAICVHPYLSGVPHRIKYFERLLADLRRREGVLFWTNEQVLDWYRGQRA